MITHQILTEDGIAIVAPTGPLNEADFAQLSDTVDAYLEKHDELRGLMILAKEFPGWENFAGFVKHLRFIRDHHERIRKVALVSDSKLASLAPELVGHFLAAQVESFPYEEDERGLAWLKND